MASKRPNSASATGPLFSRGRHRPNPISLHEAQHHAGSLLANPLWVISRLQASRRPLSEVWTTNPRSNRWGRGWCSAARQNKPKGAIMHYRCAILDDYQNVALEMADWSSLSSEVDLEVFNAPLGDQQR